MEQANMVILATLHLSVDFIIGEVQGNNIFKYLRSRFRIKYHFKKKGKLH